MVFSDFKQVLERIAEGRKLERDEARQAMEFVVKGDVNEAQTAAFLFGMRQKGETADELTGFAEAMRAAMIPVDVDVTGSVDLCGTGGDHSGSFNISTAAMFVVAGAGVPVLKHGNRSISSKSGSYDVLEALGVAPALEAPKVKTCFEQTGLAFMFAPLFHPAMKYVMPARRALGMRTFFNILGPLLNPAGVKRQLVGTFDDETAKLCFDILYQLEAERIVTVHSEDGMDEFSTAADAGVHFLGQDAIPTYTKFSPEHFGLQRVDHEALRGGDKEVNAEIIRAVLGGRGTPAQTEIVLYNAAMGIYAGGKSDDFSEALAFARESIGSGKAAEKLRHFAEATQELARD
ncbi:anthranilate phosphoribosyltransferase [Cyclonatronum proteinivorum]|uniref:Anthranilate phosphoribosyltransferase n=1 Tax=Cyclonatronum proteinivorum TaxID=1457365 RepID=A0A345UKP0_9BACT|nr:anthranilate phosphoribosyltransferase [Cyclonatronum proteinivorum]AXJ01042.1 anthranilate phosphoribosyltransferase [Cyclonatronum proteinivorum]